MHQIEKRERVLILNFPPLSNLSYENSGMYNNEEQS